MRRHGVVLTLGSSLITGFNSEIGISIVKQRQYLLSLSPYSIAVRKPQSGSASEAVARIERNKSPPLKKMVDILTHCCVHQELRLFFEQDSSVP